MTNIEPSLEFSFRQIRTVSSLCFSPDSSLLCYASINNYYVYFVDIQAKKDIAQFRGHEQYVLTCDYSPTGKMVASGSYDKMIRLYVPPKCDDNNSEGKSSDLLKGHASSVKCVRFNEDGKFLLSTCMRQLIIWDVEVKKAIFDAKDMYHEESFRNDYMGVFLDKEGQTVATGGCSNVKIWDLKQKKCVHTFEEYGTLRSLSCHTESSCVAIAGGESIFISDIRSMNKALHEFKNISYTNEMDFHPASSGKFLISCGSDGKARLFDLGQNKKIVFTIQGEVNMDDEDYEPYSRNTIRFSHDGKLFATAGGGDEIDFYNSSVL